MPARAWKVLQVARVDELERTLADVLECQLRQAPERACQTRLESGASIERSCEDSERGVSEPVAEIRHAVDRTSPEDIVREEQKRAVAQARRVDMRERRDRLPRTNPETPVAV